MAGRARQQRQRERRSGGRRNIGWNRLRRRLLLGSLPLLSIAVPMMRPLMLLPLLALLLAGIARAAAPATSEEAMVQRCRGELEERLFGSGAHGDTFVTAKAVERQGDAVVVTLSLASGEGRAIAGRCTFRDGKLFEVK